MWNIQLFVFLLNENKVYVSNHTVDKNPLNEEGRETRNEQEFIHCEKFGKN